MPRLTELETKEVSLVPTGANQKKFLVLKEDLGSSERNALADSSFALPGERKYPIHDISHARNALARASGKPEEAKVKAAVYRKYPNLKPVNKFMDSVLKAFGKKDDEDSINEALDDLSPAAQTAARAIGRIAAPHADELSASHIGEVLSQVGIDGMGSKGGSSKMKKMSPEHEEACKSAAEKAYKEHMKKLGYEQRPAGELQMKFVTPNAEKGKMDDDEDQDEAEKAKKAKEAEKAKKEKAMKEFIKADGSVDAEAVLKSADADPVLVAIVKMQQASEARVKAAEDRADAIAKEAKIQKEASLKAEMIRKAAEFKNLSQPHALELLELAHAAGPEKYESVVKNLAAQNAQIGEAGLFTEVGKAGMSDGSVDAWAKIEKAAEGIVHKSASKISKEMAIADFLETAEGMKLYAQHQASRPNGI